ncbi:MAG: VCBS repeat-containing protein [Lachnospiraceae bacterium]|nr:VCBS repeat-containing protein [Lachnospiraceae bacterium]
MIINSSQLAMNASRMYSSKSSSTQVAGWAGRKQAEADTLPNNRETFRGFINAGLNDWSRLSVRGSEAEQLKQMEKLRNQILNEFLARIHALFRKLHSRDEGNAAYAAGDSGSIMVQNSFYYEESEETEYSAAGKVITADGREIEFGVELSMSRSFAMYCEETYEFNPLPSLCDPLVINFDGSIADVSDQRICFDLDADGQQDTIAALGAGSAYLALDLNGDGKVNDGSELFGTKSGNGFADLAAYDADGNGWIDEADPIFSRLKLWVTDADGKERLYGLKEKGLGAICLSSADTGFDIKSFEDNSMKARIRKTGIFLYENGMAGTMQHVDLAKY